MKRPLLLIALVFASCAVRNVPAAADVKPPAGSSESLLIDGVAAYVNEHAVIIGDVMAVVEPVRRQLLNVYDRDELRRKLRKVYGDALNSLIERRLILDAYQDQGMTIPEWVVDKRINGIIHDMFDDDRAALMTALAKDRLTFEEWREEMVDNIIVSSMRGLNVEQNISISPLAIRDAYDSNIEKYIVPGRIKLRMIVLKKDDMRSDSALKRRRADEIRKRAADGEDFGMLAKNLSEGNKSGGGGDWGWVEPRILRPELAKTASGLQPTEISEVIETDDEFYIIKVEGRRNKSVAPFESVQAKIERGLRQKQAEVLYSSWTDRLKKKAYIKKFDVELF